MEVPMNCRRDQLKVEGSWWSSQGVVRVLTRANTMKDRYNLQGVECTNSGQCEESDDLRGCPQQGPGRGPAGWMDVIVFVVDLLSTH